jgi:hypothetical protein
LVGQDIDLRCVKLTTLNMLFFNLSSCIIWGDSLKMEVRKAYRTERSLLGGSLYECSEKEVLEIRNAMMFKKEEQKPLPKPQIQKGLEKWWEVSV